MALQNLFGNLGLDETLQKIAQHLQTIANNIGRMYPDTAGRMRVYVEASNNVTTTVQSSTSGGYNMQYDQYSQIQNTIAPIRANIKIS